MSNTTWARVVALAPELSTLTSDQQSMVVDDSILLVSTAFGDFQEMAQRYLAAHMGTVLKATSKDTTGAVQSETVGDVSITYGNLSMSDMTRYDTTAYGRKYKELLDSCIIGFTAVNL